MSKTVGIADEQVSVRHLLARFLMEDHQCEVVCDAGTGHQAIKLCRVVKPAILVLDIRLPEVNGIEVIRVLRRESPGIRVIVFTGTKNEILRLEAMKERPDAFVQKQDPLDALSDAFRAVLNGSRYFSAGAPRLENMTISSHRPGEEALTTCERCVLSMVAEGFTSKDIAVRLGVSPKTVEHHRANMMKKVGVRNAAELTRYALHQGREGE